MDFTLEELRFAQKYPFSAEAKRVVADSGLTLENIPEPVLHRASVLVSAAFSGSEYRPHIESSAGLLRDEVLAFPVAKVLVSLINRLELYRRFVRLYSDSVYRELSRENDRVIFDAASGMGMRFDFPENGAFFASVSLRDYLVPEIEEKGAKLVNRKVSGGMVFLSRPEFMRLISITASQGLKDSLPADVKGAPPVLKQLADSIDGEFSRSIRKEFSKADFGEVAPEAFPPCMAKIYSELLAGINVSHSGRFAIATFLASIGMPAEKIVDAFRRTPNFSERTTRYQVERITGVKGSAGQGRLLHGPGVDAGQGLAGHSGPSSAKGSVFQGGVKGTGYSAPSCDKMRSYNLCVANCPVSHPVQFYGRELGRGRQLAEITEGK